MHETMSFTSSTTDSTKRRRSSAVDATPRPPCRTALLCNNPAARTPRWCSQPVLGRCRKCSSARGTETLLTVSTCTISISKCTKLATCMLTSSIVVLHVLRVLRTLQHRARFWLLTPEKLAHFLCSGIPCFWHCSHLSICQFFRSCSFGSLL